MRLHKKWLLSITVKFNFNRDFFYTNNFFRFRYNIYVYESRTRVFWDGHKSRLTFSGVLAFIKKKFCYNLKYLFNFVSDMHLESFNRALTLCQNPQLSHRRESYPQTDKLNLLTFVYFYFFGNNLILFYVFVDIIHASCFIGNGLLWCARQTRVLAWEALWQWIFWNEINEVGTVCWWPGEVVILVSSSLFVFTRAIPR